MVHTYIHTYTLFHTEPYTCAMCGNKLLHQASRLGLTLLAKKIINKVGGRLAN